MRTTVNRLEGATMLGFLFGIGRKHPSRPRIEDAVWEDEWPFHTDLFERYAIKKP